MPPTADSPAEAAKADGGFAETAITRAPANSLHMQADG
jgi:hypothetical protein